MSTNEKSKWSDTALRNYHCVNGVEKMLYTDKDLIAFWMCMAVNGIPFMEEPKFFPLPEVRTLESIKRYIADIYEVETSDIDILFPGD